MIKKPGKHTLLSNTALGFIAFLGILVYVLSQSPEFGCE